MKLSGRSPMIADLSRSQKRALPALVAAYLGAALILAGVVAAEVYLDIPIGDLTRDPANTVGYAPYLGLISYLGILMWCAAATLCLFSAMALRGRGTGRMGSFLLASGLFSSILLADDLFLLHEVVFRRRLVYVAYAVALVTILLAFRRTILTETDFVILLSAGAFLAMSMVTDRLITERSSLKFLIEDGFKFLGIVGWFTYYARVSWTQIRKAFEPSLS
jgi:hypothetical protein